MAFIQPSSTMKVGKSFMRKSKKLLIVASLVLCAAVAPVCSVRPVQAAEGFSTIVPVADKTEWRYKTENGILYKRLYNVTKGCWETDYWIYVRYVGTN